MSNLYLQPETFATVQNIWDIMLTPLTGFRLLNFFLTAFSATGIIMLYFGAKWQKSGDTEIAKIAVSQGKKWFLFAAPLNIVVLPLVFFAFSPRISEALMHTPYIYLPFLASFILTVLFFYLLKRFNQESFSMGEFWTAAVLMILSVVLMATARHGIRIVSFEEPLALQAKATEAYMTNVITEYKAYKDELKNRPASSANSTAALADSKGCLACHSVDTKLVGPSYKEVAAKYTSVEQIAPSIQNGSVGKWGDVPMPAQNVTPEEAKTLAVWILQQK
jgi:cytochrome c